jgi:DNA-binding SARP family transcriptional activator
MTQPTRGHVPKPLQLSLLGGFDLVVAGVPAVLPVHAQRVLAYISVIQPPPTHHLRAALAERLWGDVAVDRAQASLRTALWRIRQAGPGLVRTSREAVWLDEAVDVDVRRCMALAGRLLGGEGELTAPDTDTSCLRGDLLPRWDEDWLLLERERVRQVQLHALEALAHRLCALGRHVDAISAAFAAIDGEPLRESAHAALIDVFLAEGNAAEARLHLDRYAALLWSELGLRPSAELTGRVRGAAVPSQRGTQRAVRTPVRRPVTGD